MAYQSIYSGKTANLPSGKANPFANDFKPGQYLAKNQPQQPSQPAAKPAPPPKPKSLMSKIGSAAKSVASAATAGEKTFATGIARSLPGGTNDLKANQAASEQSNKNIKQAQSLLKAGKIKPEQAKKLIKSNAADASTTAKETSDIVKKLPTTGQVALGAASTAADIVTGGTLPKVTKSASMLGKLARTGTQATAFGTAGALNSGAAGGNKKQMAENFVAGAALPGVFKVIGKAGGKAVERITGGQATKDLVANSKTQALMKAAEASQPAKTVNADVATDKAVNTIMSKIRAPRAVAEGARAEAEAAATKQAETEKAVATNTKLDNQIELLNAKKADGKFTNVDKVKVKQLESQKLPVEEPAATATKTASATPAVDSVPTIKAYGREIELSEENGYKATDTANGKIYSKVQRTGRNNKDSGLSTYWYDANGNKLTHAQAQDALKQKPANATLTEGSIPKSGSAETVKPPKLSARKQTELKSGMAEPTNVPIKEPEIKQPEIGQSKLAASTEQKAVDKKLTTGFEGKPEYAKVDTKLQAAHALELLKTDSAKAERIALGQELPPGDLLPESVYVAVENQALKTGNVDLLRRLATEGSLSSEATGMGQRIRMLGERDPDSAVTAMRKLADTRKAAAEKKLGKPVTKAVSEEVKQIRAAKPKVEKETFNSFVESLKC